MFYYYVMGVVFILLSFKSNRSLILGYSFFNNGSNILVQRYVRGRPYTIQTPEGEDVVLSSEAHIRELGRSETKGLSMMVYFRDLFHMSYTMHHIQTDQVNTHQNSLRRFTQSLAASQARLNARIHDTIFKKLEDGSPITEWTRISPTLLAEDVIGDINFYALFGDHPDSQTFLREVGKYLIDLFVTSEVLNHTPKVLASTIAWLTTRGHRSLRELRRILTPIVEGEMKILCNTKGDDEKKPVSYLDHLIRYYRKKGQFSISDIVQQCLAIWLAAMHQPTTALVFLLLELSLHPELISPLRQEIETNWTDEGPLLNNMKLLDSIVQESARLNSSETISLRRKATSDYTFSDGVKVKAGTTVYAPLRAMGRDPDHFNDPESFDAYRFLRAAEHKKSSESAEDSMRGPRYTDINLKYPYWGYGLDACPGRFYAAFIIKTSLVHIIRNFDIKLVDASKPSVFSWRTTIIPRASTQILVRRRQMKSTIA